jgi:glycosyltransferase involved in cell wall biosynthesis
MSTTPSFEAPMRVSVIVPVLDETTALERTVDVVLEQNAADVHELLVVVCLRTSAESMACARALQQRHPQVRVRMQERQFLGGAMQDAFGWATGTHVLMMSSDGETDPHLVATLIARAREGHDIVTATRWAEGGAFADYSPVKLALNWGFQRLFKTIYGTALTDLTYGFRIFRAEAIRAIAWEELRHPFLLETLLKPLRLGASVVEVPCVWRARTEGVSHNSLAQTFAYVPLAVRTRLRPRASLLRSGA